MARLGLFIGLFTKPNEQAEQAGLFVEKSDEYMPVDLKRRAMYVVSDEPCGSIRLHA
jgi:hypothetical protein